MSAETPDLSVWANSLAGPPDLQGTNDRTRIVAKRHLSIPSPRKELVIVGTGSGSGGTATIIAAQGVNLRSERRSRGNNDHTFDDVFIAPFA